MNKVAAGKSIFTPFKKFEYILNNKNESFTKKAESVVEVWQNLALCKFENSDIQYIVQIIDWAKLHTLNIVLTGEWKKFKGQYKTPLLREVKSTQNQLTKINNAFYMRCQKLLDVINNPWSDPTLEYLVRTSNAEIGPKEIEFFCVETAYLTSVRLKKLCESQCEDLALNLVKAFMKCYRLSQSQNFNLNAAETQVWFIFDIYVALLYKFKENDSLLDMLKGLSAEEGLNLIKRFSKKRVKISKVWKHCHRIAILASQVYISSTILKPLEEIRGILKELLTAYVTLNTSDSFLQDVTESVRSIIRLAETAAHIYVFCEVFEEQFESKMKAFTIELYIRALTTDMNLLERQKTDNDKEKMVETTKHLANGFTNLAEVLRSDINVSRECIMTAFSLQPTPERMKKIEELAKLSGFEVLDTGQVWKCKLHPPVLPSDDVTWICNECGEFMCKPQVNVPLNTNTALNEALTEEKLGITRELCDDLVVLLSSPRYQVFSWLLEWPDLQRLCLIYLSDPERTKNVVTELKFLDIDYSIFATVKKEPLDEYAGIERGYEHYLDTEFDEDQISNASEDTGSQDSRFYSMSSDSAGELHCLPFGPRKSDPNTLKSLRMFRPNLKRSRIPTETHVPEKMMRNESLDSAIPSSSKLTTTNSAPEISCQFPVNSILAINSFGQESTSSSSSSPVNSISGMNSVRQDLPFSSFSSNGISVEKPFIPIKLHPPQQNNTDIEPLGLIKPKEINLDKSIHPTQILKPIKLHPQNNSTNLEQLVPSKLDLQINSVKSTHPTQRLIPLKPDSQCDSANLEQSNKQIDPKWNKNLTPIKVHYSQHRINAGESNNIKRKFNLIQSNQNLGPHMKTYSNLPHQLNKIASSQHKTNKPGSTSTITNEFSSATQTMFSNFDISSVNDTNPKNGQVATLQQVGGQVAIDNGPTNKLYPNMIIGNPNNKSETQLNSINWTSSNHSSVNSSRCIPKTEPAATKEDVTAKIQECVTDSEKTVVEELNIAPNSYASNEPTETTIASDFPKETSQIKEENSKLTLEDTLLNECLEDVTPNTPRSPEENLNVPEEKQTAESLPNEIPNLFQDFNSDESKEEAPSQYVQVKIVEVEETKRETENVKRYSKKPKLREKAKKIEEA